MNEKLMTEIANSTMLLAAEHGPEQFGAVLAGLVMGIVAMVGPQGRDRLVQGVEAAFDHLVANSTVEAFH
jgi:hypothetical protein